MIKTKNKLIKYLKNASLKPNLNHFKRLNSIKALNSDLTMLKANNRVLILLGGLK